jgi:iron complex transport system substrate-binding protein
MKRQIYTTLVLSLITVMVIAGCAPATQTAAPSETETTDAPVALPSEETATEALGRFTIQADESIQTVINSLYGSLFAGEAPVFVEENPDLLVQAAPEDEAFSIAPLPATFLPGWQMVPQSENADLDNFVGFAISPDGQKILIDMGELPESITLTDQAGNTVEYQQPIYRVISTYGPSTAMVYGVGAGGRLVAASYLGARDEAGAAAMGRIDPRFESLIGDNYFNQDDFNLEEAANRDPDLIITSARTAWLDTVSELGVPYFLYDAETPEALKEAILLTGQLFGPNTAAQAEAWVKYYDWIEAAVLEQTDTLTEADQIKVLFTGTSPLRVASGDMIQSSLIEIAGGISVSAELTGYWNDINLEQVAAWNPDLILVPPYGGASVAAITEDAAWQILDAVQAGQVYRMPKLVAPWDTPTPDTVLAIIWLSNLLYPELDTPDCGEQVQYFYNTFYNYDISAEEIDSLCAIN